MRDRLWCLWWWCCCCSCSPASPPHHPCTQPAQPEGSPPYPPHPRLAQGAHSNRARAPRAAEQTRGDTPRQSVGPYADQALSFSPSHPARPTVRSHRGRAHAAPAAHIHRVAQQRGVSESGIAECVSAHTHTMWSGTVCVCVPLGARAFGSSPSSGGGAILEPFFGGSFGGGSKPVSA